MVVGRRSSNRLALWVGMHNLLAERRVLPTRQPRNSAWRAAEPLLHGLGILAAEQLGALQAAEGVQVVAVNKVLGVLCLP